MIHLGETARRVREGKGLSQKAAAARLEISAVHLSNVENNKAAPSRELLERYRALWGVDLYMLAWCLYCDPNDLPESVREPARLLGEAWAKQLGDLLPPDRRGAA